MVAKYFGILNVCRRNLYHCIRNDMINKNVEVKNLPTIPVYFRKYSETKSVPKKKEKANAKKRSMKYEEIPLKNIRNFSIIAHVDHGKSTLADRLLERTGTVEITQAQLLDKLQVERERGITVKAQSASLIFNHKGEDYLLNLIDTPGHVDFSNEVARSLAACQGVILLVDANQGVQAQTVANFYLAFGKDLVIVPVLNKVDLHNADPESCCEQLLSLFDIDPDDVLKISAKVGTGIDELLDAVCERIPPPKSDRSAPLRALIYDSWYDKYRGAVVLVFIQDGEVKVNDNIISIYSKKEYVVKSVGILQPNEVPTERLLGGQVGFLICNMRSVKEASIGDTLCLKSKPVEPLQRFEPAKPVVFAGVYPLEQASHMEVQSAIEKLTLNDPSVTVVNDSSPALGQGWRVGFLGLLHMEVFSQRLEQEHSVESIITAPSVTYKVKLIGKKVIGKYGKEEVAISNPVEWPEPQNIKEVMEPIVLATIICPDTYLGDIIMLCNDRRGVQESMNNLDKSRIMLKYYLPLNEIIVDFNDKLKSISSGFASFDYEEHGYQADDLVKMNILLNGTPVEELATIVHKSKCAQAGRRLCQKLLDIIPRQQFAIAIQASVGAKIYAREDIKPFRKDVTAKLYGGDVTRKKKLLARQAEGKRKMKRVGNIDLPKETFIEVLKRT